MAIRGFEARRGIPGTSFVTPVLSDSVDQPPHRGVWVGNAGDLTVLGLDDTLAVTLANVQNGTYLPFSFKRIYSTNTTATGIKLVK